MQSTEPKVLEPLKNKQSTIQSRPQSEQLPLVQNFQCLIWSRFCNFAWWFTAPHPREAGLARRRPPPAEAAGTSSWRSRTVKETWSGNIVHSVGKKKQPTDPKLPVSPSTAVRRREPAAADQQWRSRRSPPPGRRPSHQVYWLSAAPVQEEQFQGL